MGPTSAAAAPARGNTASLSPTSAASAWATPLLFWIASAAASSATASRATITTRAPCRASSSASALPRPWLAPVVVDAKTSTTTLTLGETAPLHPGRRPFAVSNPVFLK